MNEMDICPTCGELLIEGDEFLVCPRCPYCVVKDIAWYKRIEQDVGVEK